MSVHVVKAACHFTVHCKHISAVNRKPNGSWHFDDKSTFTPITPSWPNLPGRPIVHL